MTIGDEGRETLGAFFLNRSICATTVKSNFLMFAISLSTSRQRKCVFLMSDVVHEQDKLHGSFWSKMFL